MAIPKYILTASNGQLVVELDNAGGLWQYDEILTYIASSIQLFNDKIMLFDFGKHQKDFRFENFNTINGAIPTDLQDAYSKILALIPNASGGGVSGVEYNTPTNYDTVGDLPIVFLANTIHEISIVSKSGNTQITVGGEVSVLEEGQSTIIPADGLIDVAISIDSCTGAFLATTIS